MTLPSGLVTRPDPGLYLLIDGVFFNFDGVTVRTSNTLKELAFNTRKRGSSQRNQTKQR